MKISTYKKFNFKFLLTAFLLLSFSLSSCSKKVRFITSQVVPAAQGYTKISRDDNKNYAIEIEIENLAESTRLQPPKAVYVVWLETANNGTKNLGQLKSSSGFFTSGLTGTLEAVTPFKPKRVFITAEDRSNLDYPGSQAVLSTKTF
ncbi:hypothetical protein [Arcticibacter eurypsychrophilus]|uniref:hypothetical protein n=1 Tax=Arcticibacter eurypsychrophilus TaxID=1434752 RepID=UPI00084DA77A|nr:hypothetical protein [Arcticibacter eurypsychrophilus]